MKRLPRLRWLRCDGCGRRLRRGQLALGVCDDCEQQLLADTLVMAFGLGAALSALRDPELAEQIREQSTHFARSIALATERPPPGGASTP